jgi:hypothetical protein
MLLALLATFLLSVPVCSALYQVDVRLNPPGIYLGSETQVSIQVSDTDNPGWVFPNATVNITLSNQTGSNTTIPYNKTDSNGLLLFPYIPGSTGNYTLVASSTYDYNTTQYIQDGNQSATSSPVTLNVSYKPGKIGVFRNSTQKFYLDRNGNGTWNTGVDRTNNFGIKEDIPVCGEWNGTTVTEIGVFRPSTHMFYLDYNGNGVWNATTDRQ